MSFLYPNSVRVSRPQGSDALGAQAYSGLTQQQETTIVTRASAHIQPERQGAKPLPGLPGDAEGQPTWKVILKLPKCTVQVRDVLTDELGTRYQAVYAAWTPLATTVLAVRMNGLGTPPKPFPTAFWQDTGGEWETITELWAPASGWDVPGNNWEAITNTNWEAL